MSTIKYSACDLKLLISWLPLLEQGAAETQKAIKANPEKFFSHTSALYTWHEFYEIPFEEHLQRYHGCLGAMDAVNEICSSANPLEVMASDMGKADSAFDLALEETWGGDGGEHKRDLHLLYAIQTSVANSFRSLMVYGCYLNDLMAQAQSGDSSALFKAIRIDPTVLSCRTTAVHLMLAETVGDRKFRAKLKAALDGKFGKRENANFKKMRVVMRVLADVGAGRLSDDQLYELFVKELRLYTANSKSRDVIKALRRHADQYMKVNATI